MNKKKRKDWILALIVIGIAGAVWLTSQLLFDRSGDILEIVVKDEIYGTYDLNEDQEIVIGKTNRCRIEDGIVTMTDASCPDQLCIHQSPIDSDGGTIICLPNQVILRVNGSRNKNDTLDAST